MAHAASNLGFDGNFATWMPKHLSSDASGNPISTRQLRAKTRSLPGTAAARFLQSRSDVPIAAQGRAKGELREPWRNPGTR